MVCVTHALEQTVACLNALLAHTERRFQLILVDDGSGDQASDYLKRFADAHPTVRLIVNHDPPHGYTVAANLGVAEAKSDYVVLLNSDTVVTPGWLDRIIACGESDPEVGVIGPVSNAASHQSIPKIREGSTWATNPPPAWLSPLSTAFLVALAADRSWSRVPLLNGFCLTLKRNVIEHVGRFDEEAFPYGFGEENDFCIRAGMNGFSLAIADDVYVYHSKSSSYGNETRVKLSKDGGQALKAKHGESRVRGMVEEIERDVSLAPLRNRMADAYASEEGLVRIFRELVTEPLDAQVRPARGRPWRRRRCSFGLPGGARTSAAGS